MKKSQHIVAISITAFIMQLSFSVSAQSLYTQGPGDDPTWKYIMDNNLIPVGQTSTKGITGTDIDVNQEHPAISSSPYANRTIQQGTAIHTMGNATVRRSDFPKWSRWYQEDENTQVFRVFKGEINVRNDVYYKPRIEAELDNHSKGTKILNNSDWVEWSGTYTVVKPVESNIFQIWSNNDYVLMLTMKNDGRIQMNPRNGDSHQTMISNATGKSFDIRVRDYGNRYVVYLNNEQFYARNYDARYGNDRAAHFRWGIYASRKKGDRSGVPQDGLMFVTGAQRKYSNDVQEPTAIGPEGYSYAVKESETVKISNIPFDVAYGQDGKYEFLMEQREDVACTNEAFGNDPSSGVQKYCFIRESKLPYSENAIQIPGIIEAEYYDFGGPGRSYVDNDPENRGDVGFREENGVDIDKGANGDGYAVGWMTKGEWLEYTIDVTQGGTYDFNFYTASLNGTGVLGVDIDGEELVTGLQTPQTGDWDVYTAFSTTAELSKGIHVIRLNVEQNGLNLDKIELIANSLSITDLEKEAIHIYPNPSETGIFLLSAKMPYRIYTINGKLVAKDYSEKVDLSKFSHGIYILRSGEAVVKLIK